MCKEGGADSLNSGWDLVDSCIAKVRYYWSHADDSDLVINYTPILGLRCRVDFEELWEVAAGIDEDAEALVLEGHGRARRFTASRWTEDRRAPIVKQSSCSSIDKTKFTLNHSLKGNRSTRVSLSSK